MKFNFWKTSSLFRNSFFVFCTLMIANSCNLGHKGKSDQLENDVDSFAQKYYNWQFEDALPYCTSDSKKWLQYAASNVHKADINLLRNKNQGASYEINDINYNNGDTTAIINIKVYNFLQMDTIGNSGRIIPSAVFLLKAVFHHEWKIKMEGLPRSEKQNHD
ncbi:MAG TPA: hypothetical protein DCS83_09430 [Prevotella sp.]|nr:hypothetical protein [Prevotella sp.]